MLNLSLTFPFVLGLVAAFNPCGFIMLPNYLSYFLGLEGDRETEATPVRDLLRAALIGLTMSAGFFVVFGLFGIVTSGLLSQGDILSKVPYVTFGFGILLIPVGIAMVMGYEPKFTTPRMNKGGGSRELPSVFLFGVSYATISLSCTVPLFISAVISSFTDDGVVEGTGAFIAYATGMATVVIFLTMSVALARSSIVRRMRQVLPYVNRISGGLLIAGGAYLIAYGWFEIQVVLRNNNVEANPIQQRFEDFQAHLNNWVSDVGGPKVGIGIVLLIAAMFVWALRGSMDRRDWYALVAGFGGTYLVLEFVKYRADLFVLGTAHVLEGYPERIVHWFTDPIRWGVPIEILFTALVSSVLFIVGRTIAKGQQQEEPLLVA